MGNTWIPVSPAGDANTVATPRPALELLPPLYLQRVQNDSFLTLSSWNSLAGLQLGIRARVLCDDGSLFYVDEQHTPNNDRSVKFTYHQLRAGILLDLSVFPVTGTPVRGQTYAVVSIADRLQPVPQRAQPIAKGYVTNGAGLVWPHGAWCDSVEGPGWRNAVALNDPDVATDFGIGMPTGARWAVRAVVATLTTDATVATRVPSLIIGEGSYNLFKMPYPTGQAASLAYTYYWANLAYAVGKVGTDVYVPVPLPWSIPNGGGLASSTTLMGPADQWSSVVLDVEEWIEA